MTPGKTYIVTDPVVANTGKHQRWMAFARKKAQESTFPGPRMGSVIVSGGRPIAWGTNRPSSGRLKDRNYDNNQAMHAELAAVLAADPESLKGAIVYVAGISYRKDADLWSSKCCNSCQKMLKSYGVRAVIYHDKDRIPHIWRVS